MPQPRNRVNSSEILFTYENRSLPSCVAIWWLTSARLDSLARVSHGEEFAASACSACRRRSSGHNVFERQPGPNGPSRVC